VLGLLVPALAIGTPAWLQALSTAAPPSFASAAMAKMDVGPLFVPACGAPIRVLALGLLRASRRFTVRRTAGRYGGRGSAPQAVEATALTFPRRCAPSKALSSGVISLHRYLLAPLEEFVITFAERRRRIQSGDLNFYLSLIGALPLAILVIALA
jgi:hydrogenase-4 component B